MNHPVDVHPEDLLDRDQNGTLTADEQRRLELHTSRCSSCALVRRASRDFAVERAPKSGDDAMLARLSGVALGEPALEPSIAPAASSFLGTTFVTRRRRQRPWALAAIVMFAASGAAASFWSVRGFVVPHLFVRAPPAIPSIIPRAVEFKGPVPVHKPAPAERPLEPALEAPAAAAHERAPHAASKPREAPAPSVAAARPVEEPAAPTADQLFASANDARRRGDSGQAVKLYRQLQQQHPNTREEATSRVLLGRLLIDRGEDASQALALFTRYLDASPNGTLAEEARVGRALALMRLGRSQEERLAWQKLLSLHPDSIHAERARKRLDELR